jgi:hypothetical protein
VFPAFALLSASAFIVDHGHKRPRDQEIEDSELRRICMVAIHDRLVPEIQKAFQFRATRMERHIVACYDAADNGHFRAHRDNTTKGTAHRRFAVSLFLNTGEYDGRFLSFPEFGRQLYSAPVGGAVVFGCSLCIKRRRSPVAAATCFCRFFMTMRPRASARRTGAIWTILEPEARPRSRHRARASKAGEEPPSRCGAACRVKAVIRLEWALRKPIHAK